MTKKVAKFTAEQIAALAKGTREKASADRAAAKAQERREGSYVTATRLAGTMGAEAFDEAMGALFADIRKDGKTARAFGAKANDKGDGWLVPSSLSSARSVLVSALTLGVDLYDEEGEPLAFTAIRKADKSARDALKAAERKDHEVSRDEAVAALRELADKLAGMESDAALGEFAEGLTVAVAEIDAEVSALMGEGDDDATDADQAAAA